MKQQYFLWHKRCVAICMCVSSLVFSGARYVQATQATPPSQEIEAPEDDESFVDETSEDAATVALSDAERVEASKGSVEELLLETPQENATQDSASMPSLKEEEELEDLVDVPDEEAALYEAKTAFLYILDKTTAQRKTLEAPVGQVVKMGPLRINVCQCYKNHPETSPEARAYLDIWYAQEGQATEHIFSGWMFSSSPSVSALEHPSYDVWVKDCE